jgi:predicted ATP-grasp superfamily ATP-dependent carboligase
VRIFVHEFITSGALSGRPLPPSLLREGAAMRKAVITDLLLLPDVTVVTTRDERVAGLEVSGLTELNAANVDLEAELFRSLCGAADRCLIIAPEIDGELERRTRIAAGAAGRNRVLNSPELIAAASDKWETFRRLRAANVPTIETCLGNSPEWRAWDRPVAKPRDGAGSQGVRRLSGAECEDIALAEQSVVQPFLCGRWLSCTALFRADGNVDVFPPAEQHIADDGTFSYLGGAIPAVCDTDRVQTLAMQAIGAIAGAPTQMIGPVGVDLVEDAATGELLVCEINPRFTTSYVAARELAEGNPLAGILTSGARLLTWKPARIAFDATGHIRPANR